MAVVSVDWADMEMVSWSTRWPLEVNGTGLCMCCVSIKSPSQQCQEY